MSALERRYRWLLRSYPADYRAQRADEMLGTLLETAVPGQRWPRARESAALIAGGLRARAGRNASLPLAANLRLAALLACATYAGLGAAMHAGQLIVSLHFGNLPSAALPAAERRAVMLAGLFTATVLIWFVRQLIAVLALAAVLMAGSALATLSPSLLLITGVLAILIALRPERLPRSWLCWFFLLPLWSFGRPVFGPLLILLGAMLLAVFVLAPLVWAVTDARPALALAMLLAYLALFGLNGRPTGIGPVALTCLGISLAAALPFALRTVRRRRMVL